MTAAHIVPSPLREPTLGATYAQPAGPETAATYAERVAAQNDTEARKARYRAAAHLALKVYPTPIARLVKAELDAWIEWGFRLGALPVEEALYAQVMQDAREAGAA